MKKIRGGYYIKARQIKNSDIAHAPPHIREIWDYLIREANHSGKKKRGEILERGQILTTYDEIRNDLHWMVGWRKERYTKHQCEIAMKFLRKPRRNGCMITTRKTTRGLIITILNYDYYQNPKNYECHNDNYNDNHNENGNSPQTTDTIDKNGNKDKNKDTPPNPPRGEYTESFERFWKMYPKKVGKDAAFKKWQQIGKSKKATAGELIQAIIIQVQANHFSGSNGDSFIPNPQTWLNQGRWKDEIKSGGACNPPPANLDPETRYQDC